MGRTALQVAIGIMALILAVTAVVCLVLGVRSPLYEGAEIMGSTEAIDSQIRTLCGMVLGIAVVLFWRVIPRVERETTLFRALVGIGILGGFGRLISLLSGGMPPPSLFGFTVVELIVMPALVYWQWRLARHYAAEQ